MGKVQGAGGTLKANLESIWEQTGVKPEELQDIDFPEGAAHIWESFLDLHTSRGMGVNGPNPLTFSDILAWSTLTGLEITPFELNCITALDSLWLSTINKDQ
jgi:hypothetical protein